MPTIDINDTTLYYERAGSGPAILFVHGMCGFGDVWADQARRLDLNDPFLGRHRSYPLRGVPTRGDRRDRVVRRALRNDHNETDAHVENPVHLGVVDATDLADQLEDGR